MSNVVYKQLTSFFRELSTQRMVGVPHGIGENYGYRRVSLTIQDDPISPHAPCDGGLQSTDPNLWGHSHEMLMFF